MRLYLKILLACLTLTALLLAAFGAFSYRQIDRSFRALEIRRVQESVLLARDVMREELDRIGSLCQDWGNWDDLYDFCKGKNPDFPRENILPRTLEVLRINYLLILDSSRTTLSETAITLPSLKPAPLPAAFKIRFLEEGYFDHVLTGKRLSGFMNLGPSVLAFTAVPVQKTDGMSDVPGVIVFGSFVRENLAVRLRERLGEEYSVLSFKDQSWYSAQEMPVNLDGRGVVPITTVDNHTISGALLFGDISGIPAFALICRQQRDIYQSGYALWTTLMSGWAGLLLLCLAGMVPVYLYLATGRLRTLTRLLRSSRENPPTIPLLPARGNGLTSELTESVNHLLLLLRNAQTACQLAEQRYQSAFSATPDGLLICDLATRNIIDCNRSLETLLQLPRAAILGQPVELLFPADDKYLYMLDHLARQQEFHGELELRNALGQRLPAEFRTLTFALDGRQVLQASIRDLSAMREAQLREERIRSELAAASRLRSEFLTTLSHEMRTPLSALIGFTDLAAEARSTPEALGWLKNIRRESVHLLDLVNNLLDHSAIDAGRVAVRAENADLRAFLRSLATATQALLHNKKSVRFFLNIADNVGRTYRFDPLRLRQILLNLLGNAVKFTARGSVTLRVEAEAQEEADQLTFAVIDTGIGIPEEAQPHIFESFVQASENVTREYGGTGLGAAIANKLTRLMGGQLTFRSTVGKGSEFTLTLPLQTPEQAVVTGTSATADPGDISPPPGDAATPSALTPPELPTESGHAAQPAATASPTATTALIRRRLLPANILLVEDYALNRQVASAFIRHSGHNLFTCFNGQDAVAKCLKRDFDLILMDVQLPVLDGMEATRQIRAQGPNRSTPIIGLTAYAEAGTIAACRAAGMNEVLAKPFAKEDFYAMLNRTVGELPPAQEQAASPEQLPREYIVQHFFFGKRELAQKALDIFLKDAQTLLAAIAKGIDDGDTAVVQHSAHQVKSGAGYLGLSALQDICQSITEQARTGLADGLDVLLKDATLEYQRIRTLRAVPADPTDSADPAP